MSVSDLLKAKAAKLREAKKSGGAKPATTAKPEHRSAKKAPAKKSAAKGERKQRESRASESDLKKVAAMYSSGKTVSQISDSLGWTDKKSNWPYSYAYGILKRLRADKTIKGKRSK